MNSLTYKVTIDDDEEDISYVNVSIINSNNGFVMTCDIHFIDEEQWAEISRALLDGKSFEYSDGDNSGSSIVVREDRSVTIESMVSGSGGNAEFKLNMDEVRALKMIKEVCNALYKHRECKE